MGLCPSRAQAKAKGAPAVTSARPAKPTTTLRADAAAFVPQQQAPQRAPQQQAAKEEWELYLDAKRRGGKKPFARRQDGTFTSEYRKLLGKDRPAGDKPAAPATGILDADMVAVWKEAVTKQKKAARPEALRRKPPGLSPPSSPPVRDDLALAGSKFRSTPAGFTDLHYLSDDPDASESHRHRRPAPSKVMGYVPVPASADLEQALSSLLHELALLKSDGKRSVVGMREVSRAGKEPGHLKAVLVAQDLDGAGNVDAKLQALLAQCGQTKTPVVFGLTRQRLGQAVKKSVTVSVMGILDVRGCQEAFDRVIALA